MGKRTTATCVFSIQSETVGSDKSILAGILLRVGMDTLPP